MIKISRLSLVCFIFLLMALCPLTVSSKSGQDSLDNGIAALRDAKGSDIPAARAALEELVKKYPDASGADDALLEIGRSLLSDEQYTDAANRFQAVLEQYPAGDARYEARYLLGTTLYKLGKLDDASRALEKIDARDPHYVEASLLLVRILLKQGKTADAVQKYAAVRKLARDSAQVSDLDKSIRESLTGLPDKTLEDLVKNLPNSQIGMTAMYILADRAYAVANYGKARELFIKFLAQYPNDPKSADARAILLEIDNIQGVNKNAIGLVLPLSGKWASFGRRFLYGAALALGAFSANPDSQFPYEIYVMDSKSDPETARRAVEVLCTEKRVIAIIGPVQSDEASAAAKEAQACGVPIITLTQVEEVTRIGNMVFRNFITPRDQARTVAWYAIKALGIKTFSILYPDHDYGRLFKKVFEQEVTQQGGEVVLSQPYPPGQADFRNEIRAIAREKRGIQALFIPDTYYIAASVGPQLRFYNVVRMQLLGTSGWDSPKLIELVQPQVSAIEGALFTDAFFAQSPEPMVRDFVHEFSATYGYDPEIYEATAYETARVVGAMISEKRVTDRLKMRDALAALTNFQSFTGNLQAMPDRSFRRPLFLLQVKQGEIVDISTTTHF